jgi:hypothetical protein
MIERATFCNVSFHLRVVAPWRAYSGYERTHCCAGQYLIVTRRYRSLELAVTVKPFDRRELRGTVTICPELKIANQQVTQK